LRRSPVIAFFEKTWLLWWIVAILIILRWFHLLRSSADDEGVLESENPVPAGAT
jgi:hypothetical protein